MPRNAYKTGIGAYEDINMPNLMDLLLRQEDSSQDAANTTNEPENAIDETSGIMAKAVGQAEAILAKARDEAKKICEEAYEEGYIKGTEEGCARGERDAYEEHKQRLNEELEDARRRTEEQIRQQIEEVAHVKEKVLEEYMDDLKDIAISIGEKIVQTSLKSSGEVVKNMILSATGKLRKTSWAKIYVSGDSQDRAKEIQGDADMLRELSRLSDNVKIVVMEDAAPGTCIVELPSEVIDISVGTQMENIKEIINNAGV